MYIPSVTINANLWGGGPQVCHITESVVNHTAASWRQVKLSKSMSYDVSNQSLSFSTRMEQSDSILRLQVSISVSVITTLRSTALRLCITRFNVQYLGIYTTERINPFRLVSTINSDCSLNINRLIFITKIRRVSFGVRTELLNIIYTKLGF